MTMQSTNNLYVLYTYNGREWCEYAYGFPFPHAMALELVCELACRGILANAVAS